jgi:hypothetical protein
VGGHAPRAIPREAGPRGRGSQIVKLVVINAGVFLLLCVLVEGLASTVLFFWDATRRLTVPERRHTSYDAELGWVNVANVDIPDMYGPGVFLRTNTQGFRGNRTVPAAVPPGKRRVICSGDSMTLGFGVDDDHSWCSILESLDPRLETVNMAQGGYGVDQAYLWYKRDGGALRHHVHLFAVIADDFNRMASDTFLGYGKPLLAIENGSLVVKNVPVPVRSYVLPALTTARQNLSDLRVMVAMRRLYGRLWTPGGTMPATGQARNEATAQVAFKVLQDLKRLNAERSSTFIVVYLPTFYRKDLQDFWSTTLERQTSEAGIPLINLAEAFEQLPNRELLSLYLPDNFHFNAKGNAYVAKAIYERLKTLPGAGSQEAHRRLRFMRGRQNGLSWREVGDGSQNSTGERDQWGHRTDRG